MGNTETTDVCVVGAGLAGLTAALVAARAGRRVLVLDAHEPGGRARTDVVDPGVTFNRGPRALYSAGAGAAVLAELGIEPRGSAASTVAHARLGDGVHRLPDNAWRLARTPLLSAAGKLRAGALLASIQRIDATRYDHVSVADWLASRRLDPGAVALVRSVIRLATYVDDVDEFSAGVAIRQLQGVLGPGVRYLDHGWQQLVDALLAELRRHGTEVRRARVSRTEPAHPHQICASDDNMCRLTHRIWTSGGAGGGEVRAGAVVLALGTPDAVAAVSPVAIERSGLGEPATAACLELALRRPPRVSILLGIDEPLYLSRHTPAADLAPPGVDVVHVMRYGSRSSDEDRAALWAHARAAGIEDADVVAQRFLRRMVVTGGIPTAAAGGLAGRPPVRVAGGDGLFLAGDWVGDEGLLADAAFASGRAAGHLAASAAAAATDSTAATRTAVSG